MDQPRRTPTGLRGHGRTVQQGNLRLRLRAGIGLARSTPGLSVYLGGGLAVWLFGRALVGDGLASSPLGALAVGALRLLGLALVVALYFRRTGQLAQAHDDLRRLRLLLVERHPGQVAPSPSQRRLFRLLAWTLRVRG